MVAERIRAPSPLALLYEPDRPGQERGRMAFGWRYVHARREIVRDHTDDAFGATVQRVIVRYVVGGERRGELAAEIGMGETQVQNMLRGATWGSYARPVLRALRRLGITPGRGDWAVGSRRSREIIIAQRTVLRAALAALDDAPHPGYDFDNLHADLRLLTIVW